MRVSAGCWSYLAPRPFRDAIDGLLRHGPGISRVADHEPPKAAVTDAERILVARVDRRQWPPLRELGPDAVDVSEERDAPHAPGFWRGLGSLVPRSLLGAWQPTIRHGTYIL